MHTRPVLHCQQRADRQPAPNRDGGHCARPTPGQHGLGRGEFLQRGGFGWTSFGPYRVQLLAEIQVIAQLPPRLLPRSNLFRSAWTQQPPSQTVSAQRGTRTAEQLKQRAAAKQIQIARVRMLSRRVAFTPVPILDPLSLQPIECLGKEPHAAAGPSPARYEQVLDRRQRQHRDGDRQQDRRYRGVEDDVSKDAGQIDAFKADQPPALPRQAVCLPAALRIAPAGPRTAMTSWMHP